jgi:hypothetical protein
MSLSRLEFERIEEDFRLGKDVNPVDLYRLTEYIRELHKAIWAHKDEVCRLVGTGNVGIVHKLLWGLVEDYRKHGD